MTVTVTVTVTMTVTVTVTMTVTVTGTVTGTATVTARYCEAPLWNQTKAGCQTQTQTPNQTTQESWAQAQATITNTAHISTATDLTNSRNVHLQEQAFTVLTSVSKNKRISRDAALAEAGFYTEVLYKIMF